MSRQYLNPRENKHDRIHDKQEHNRNNYYDNIAKKKSFHKKNQSESSSSESSSSQSPRKVQQLYAELKNALEKHQNKEVIAIVKDLSRILKQDIGILRVTIPNTFSFSKNDLEQFFGKFGRIQNVIIKQTKLKEPFEDKKKSKQFENIAYIIFYQYFSAVIALKVVQSVSEKQKIVDAKICFTDNSIMEQEISNPLIGHYEDQEFIANIENQAQLTKISENYRYVGTIGIDLQDKYFCLKDRIMGVKGCNFLRIYYICQKAVRFENQIESQQNDLQLKLINNKSLGTQRQVIVLANNLTKYNTAIRNLHQLFQQIVEEYKNSREKSIQIIPKDVHIRRWQKFKGQPTLKFLEPKAL